MRNGSWRENVECFKRGHAYGESARRHAVAGKLHVLVCRLVTDLQVLGVKAGGGEHGGAGMCNDDAVGALNDAVVLRCVRQRVGDSDAP